MWWKKKIFDELKLGLCPIITTNYQTMSDILDMRQREITVTQFKGKFISSEDLGNTIEIMK